MAGQGEIPIGIASSPTEKGFIKFTVNKVGKVSSHIHNMQAGDIMGVRGPLGNWYPWELLRGQERGDHRRRFRLHHPALVHRLHARSGEPATFGDITVVYGARFPGLLLYKEELAAWEQRDDIRMHITVDGTNDPNWKYNVGFVPAVTKQKAPSSDNAYAIICGPPIMIKFTLPVLTELGFPPERIISSLEMRMKCGIGICGRCNIGTEYVCKDGPVFTLEQLARCPTNTRSGRPLVRYAESIDEGWGRVISFPGSTDGAR